jgi:serine/threonine-protein kinase
MPSPELRRVSMELGTDASLVSDMVGPIYGAGNAIMLTPDGRTLAFVARPREGAPSQIYVRRLDELQAVPLSGTEGAINPFFSPDGQWIGYFADRKLRKIPVAGGGAVTICTALNNRGGAWSENGVIVFSPDRERASLWQVPSSGGEAKPLIALAEGETTQRWPQLLRGGAAVLFTGNSRPDGFEEANVVVQVLPNGPRKTVVPGAYYGRYLSSGHLLYGHNGSVFAAPFDLDRLELTGPPIRVLEGAFVNMPVGAAEIAVSNTGTLAYLAAPEHVDYMHEGMDWMDRDGRTTPLRTTPARWLHPRFAPDGRRLAFDDFDGLHNEIWIFEWSHGELTRLTFGGGSSPVWTPDARRIVFRTATRGTRNISNLYWQRSDGTGEVQQLTEASRPQLPLSWHPNGKVLALSELDPETGTPSLMMLRLEGDEASGWRPAPPVLFLKDADDAMFSPDGHWLAYVAKTPAPAPTPAVMEVYVRPFPGPGNPWQVSAGGGTGPVWSLTRHELLYGTPDHRVMAASYSASGVSFHAEKPHVLTDVRFKARSLDRSFDLHPDGERFVLAKATETKTETNRAHHVTVIFNFYDELQKLAPAKK